MLDTIFIDYGTNCGKRTGFKEDEDSHTTGIETIFVGVTYFLLIALSIGLPFAFMDVADFIFKFYANIPALMIYSVLLYATVIFPLAYFLKWLENRVRVLEERGKSTKGLKSVISEFLTVRNFSTVAG